MRMPPRVPLARKAMYFLAKRWPSVSTTKCVDQCAIFVSWHTIVAPDEVTVLRTLARLAAALSPRMFQHKLTFFCDIEKHQATWQILVHFQQGGSMWLRTRVRHKAEPTQEGRPNL